jgi:hypothetical protein
MSNPSSLLLGFSGEFQDYYRKQSITSATIILLYCDVFTVLEKPFGLLLRLFTTSLVVTTILVQCALFTSVLIFHLGWPSDCWLLGCSSDLTPLISSDVASLIGSFDLP